MIKALIFDFFGVLIADNFTIAYEKLGGNLVADQAFIDEIVNASNNGWITPEESRNRVAERLGVDPMVWLEAVMSGETRDDRVFTWIETMRPKYKTALLSNVSTGGLYRRLPEDELRQYFDVWIASGDVGFAKPSPEIYHLTANKLGLQEDECLFFDDREEYVVGAKAVGMHTILYRSFEQAKAEAIALLSQPA